MAANQPNPAEVLWGQTLLVGHCPAHNGGMGVGWWRMGATPLSHCDSLPVTAAGLPNIIPPPFQHLLSSFEQPISPFSKSIPILYPRPLLLFCSGDKHATMRGGWCWLVLSTPFLPLQNHSQFFTHLSSFQEAKKQPCRLQNHL